MKVLVTGAAGFIASHIAERYLALGHDVAIIDDLSSGKRENLPGGARFYQAEIGSREAARIVRDERPELLNHHAAQMDVRRSVADPTFDARVNILGFINLLEAAREAGTKRIIFASSGGAVYGEQDSFPAPEAHPTRPLSPYGISKRSGELYLFFYHQVHGIPYIALRYSNVFGPRQDPHGEAGVVAIFSQRLLSGQKVVINGDGGQTRDYVFVEDVVEANVRALDCEFIGPVNIGTGVETDVNRLFGLIREKIGTEADASHGPAKPGEQRRSVIDNRLAGEVMGWRPEVGLEEGIERTVAFFRGRSGG